MIARRVLLLEHRLGCLGSARAIALDLVARGDAAPTLRGAAEGLLVLRALGPAAPLLPAATVRRIHETSAACLRSLDTDFYGGSLGLAWTMALLRARSSVLDRVDAAILGAIDDPWDGPVGVLDGGLAGIGLYGLARVHTAVGRRVVDRCVELLATSRVGAEDGDLRGGLGALGFLCVAAEAGVERARALARSAGEGLARALAARAGERRARDDGGGGLLPGRGTWADGMAGLAAVLLGVARLTRGRAAREAAAEVALRLADAPPEACDAIDSSLASGTAGIACVLQGWYEWTGRPRFRFAAEHWHRRTLAAAVGGGGLGGYLHFGAIRDTTEGGSTWASRPGLLDGAAGTALSLVAAARGGRSNVRWRAALLL